MAYTWPVTAAEAKTQLSKTDTVDDTELQGFVEAITAVVESITGPIAATSYTESIDGGESTIALRHLPVVSVTSITEYQGNNAVTLTEATTPAGATSGLNYSLDKATGVITRLSGPGWAYPFFVGTRNIVVTYTAGYATAPANVRLAALELIRENWTQSKNGGRRPQTDDGYTINGWFVPNRVHELLRPNAQIPGIG